MGRKKSGIMATISGGSGEAGAKRRSTMVDPDRMSAARKKSVQIKTPNIGPPGEIRRKNAVEGGGGGAKRQQYKAQYYN